MEILDDDDRRPVSRERSGEARPGARELIDDKTWLEFAEGSSGSGMPAVVASAGDGSRELLLGQLEPRERCAGAAKHVLGGHVRRVVERDPEGLPKNLRECPVRDPATGRSATAGEHVEVAPRASGGKELDDQAALADSRGSVDEHEAGRRRFQRLVQQAAQVVQLAIAPDQRRPQRRHARLAARTEALDAVGDQRTRLAFHLERRRLPEANETSRHQLRSLSNQHRSRLG